MDVTHILDLLRRRWPALALCILAGISGAAVTTQGTPRTYRATVRLLVTIPAARGVSEALQGVQLSSQLLQSYSRVSTSRPAAAAIVARLGLKESADSVQARLSASPETETLIIAISAVDTNPVRARNIANTAADVLSDTVDRLEPANSGNVSMRVFDPAITPGAPVSPRPKLNLAVGILLGIVAGLGAALLLEQVDRSIKTPAQAAAAFSAPLLAVVPRRRDAATSPLIAGSDPGAAASEAYRALRTAVRFIDPDDPLKTLLVTSPSAQEGKTSTAANLAIALAQSGERVILVDADLRRARIADHFGLESAVGLTSVVTHQVELRDALQGWRDDLAILASGPLPPNPAELLGSQSMSALVQELAGIADIVIFDAPPVLPVTDSVVLATQVDGVLLVGRAGRTQRNFAAEASRRLQAVGAHVVGFVLSSVPSSATQGYYADYDRQHDRQPGRVSLPRRRATDAVEDRGLVRR